MLGSIIGSQLSAILGSILGSTGNDEGPIGSTTDLLVAIIGQSNSTGEADFGSSGGSDGSYGITNIAPGFSQCQLDAQWANGGFADPIVWSNLNNTTLVAYAASGQANMGIEQSLGRYLIKYGIATNPAIIKFGVLGTSLQNHWLPAASVPINGGKLADQCITYLNTRATQYGRKIDIIIWIQGETDATDATSSTNYQANLTTLMNYIRAGLGQPSVPIIIQGINTTSSAAFRSTVAAAQAAYVVSDANSRLLPIFDVRLHTDPHYDSCGCIGCGDMNAGLVQQTLKPGLSTNLVPLLPSNWIGPYYQQADAIFPCIASSTMTPRSGANTLANDFELGVLRSGTVATTHALTTANGFASAIAAFVGTFSTNIQTMSVWSRLVTSAQLLANLNRAPSPLFTVGVAPLNISRIFGFRNVNQTTPIILTTTGANNANTTALNIPGGVVPNNSLCVFIMCSAGANQKVVNISPGSGITNTQIIWDGTANPGSGVTHMAMAVGYAAVATTVGTTAVTFNSVNNNVGALIVLQP